MPPLYVVCCISNPVMYKRRYELYREFRERMESNPNIILYTVEMAFGERPFEVTSSENVRDIQVRGRTELWHKENLLNIGFSKLPTDWQYAAWIDSDIAFARPDWAEETVHQLQHYDVVQMFSQIYDMKYNFESNGGLCNSFMRNWISNGRVHYNEYKLSYADPGAPGYAWAFTRNAFDTLGSLYAEAILGSADFYMAKALTDATTAFERDLEKQLTPEYVQSVADWKLKADKLHKNIGVVSGTIFHYWHGPRSGRGYDWRNRILIENTYSPLIDISYDQQGLLVLNDNKPKFRDDLRNYFRQRNEDSLS